MTLMLTLAAVALLAVAAARDVAVRRIPNRVTGLLALVGLARIAWDHAHGGGATVEDLSAGAAVFGLGALAFRFRLFGGGDVKLLAGCALWLGAGGVAPLLAGTALAGGALALGFVALAAFAAPAPAAARPSVPYGAAIALGALFAATLGT